MYNLMDAGAPWVSIIYCICLVFIVAFGNLNVILAVISEAVTDLDRYEDPSINK